MTKRFEYYTCMGCKKPFHRPETKQHYCSDNCRFFTRVNKTDSCWIWTGSFASMGYGEFRFRGKLFRTHRYSYQIHHGDIPAWLSVLHKCDNKACVNPSHLYAGTHAQNSQDAEERDLIGSRKLTRPQALSIKKMLIDGKTQTEIAKMFGVSQCSVWNIHAGKTWKTVTL